VLTAFAAGLRRPLAILGKTAVRPGVMALTAASVVALFATSASRLRGARGIAREIAAAVLSACLASTRCLLAVFGEIARIIRMSLVSHY
jgi:hypothetical protein